METTISTGVAAFLGVWYYFVSNCPWNFNLGFIGLQKPIFGGWLVGVLLGDMMTGLQMGAAIQVLYIANISAGGSQAADPAFAGIVGVALAMVREMVERTIPNPTAKDIAELKKEAKELAMNSGAVEDSVEVYVEIDEQAQKVTAIAMGSTEVKTTDLMKNCDEKEAVQIAAESIGVPEDQVELAASNGQVFVVTCQQGSKRQLRVIDKKGFIKIQRSDGGCLRTTMADAVDDLKKIWDASSNFSSEVRINPDAYVIVGSRVIDYSGIPEYKQVAGLIEAELADREPDDEIILVLARNALR